MSGLCAYLTDVVSETLPGNPAKDAKPQVPMFFPRFHGRAADALATVAADYLTTIHQWPSLSVSFSVISNSTSIHVLC
jgi:hypothetical protein